MWQLIKDQVNAECKINPFRTYSLAKIEQDKSLGMTELQVQTIRFTLTSLYVGTRNGSVFSFEVADLSNKNLDSSRSLFVNTQGNDPEYNLM